MYSFLKYWVLLVLYFFCSAVIAQKIDSSLVFVKTKLNKKSILLGKSFEFGVEVVSPKEYQIVLPDSTSQIGKFVLKKIYLLPTQLQSNTLQKDSVSYTLVCLEPDSFQLLSIPVKMYTETDSLIMYSKVDTLFLQKPKNITAFVAQNKLVPLKKTFNYQLWLLGIVLGATVFWILKKYMFSRVLFLWNKLNFKNRFNKYHKSQLQLIHKLHEQHDTQILTQFIATWKLMMSELSSKPISTYTSTEINQIYKDQRLYEAFKQVDKALYSNIFEDDLIENLQVILQKSIIEYQNKHN